jgi:hypothetical protein
VSFRAIRWHSRFRISTHNRYVTRVPRARLRACNSLKKKPH